MTKETESKKIKEQINVLLNGKGDRKFLSFEKKCRQYKISSREKAVLKYMLAGLEVKEIAGKLFVSIQYGIIFGIFMRNAGYRTGWKW